LQTALGQAGVTWHLGTTIKELKKGTGKNNDAYHIVLENGEGVDTDLVVSAIGLRARTELAKQAGLTVNRGIVVAATLQSTNESIYALGDCAEVAGQVLPYVMPIMHGARALAKTLANESTGEATPVVYPVMPVIVKTTLHPIVVAGTTHGSDVSWQIEHIGDGVKAIATNNADEMTGFCLTGVVANKEKQALLKEIN